MSKFFVGQRVRIVNATGSPRNGCEARIMGYGFSRHAQFGPGEYWECHVDGWGIRDTDGTKFAYMSHQLEPIAPSGAQPSEFTTLHDLLDSLEGIAA